MGKKLEDMQILVEDKHLSYKKQVALYQNLLDAMGYYIVITEKRCSGSPDEIEVTYEIRNIEKPSSSWGGAYLVTKTKESKEED